MLALLPVHAMEHPLVAVDVGSHDAVLAAEPPTHSPPPEPAALKVHHLVVSRADACERGFVHPPSCEPPRHALCRRHLVPAILDHRLNPATCAKASQARHYRACDMVVTSPCLDAAAAQVRAGRCSRPWGSPRGDSQARRRVPQVVHPQPGQAARRHGIEPVPLAEVGRPQRRAGLGGEHQLSRALARRTRSRLVGGHTLTTGPRSTTWCVEAYDQLGNRSCDAAGATSSSMPGSSHHDGARL